MLAQAGLPGRDSRHRHGRDGAGAPSEVPDTEDAIRADPRLGAEQKAALIAVYRSMLGSPPPSQAQPSSQAEPTTEPDPTPNQAEPPDQAQPPDQA